MLLPRVMPCLLLSGKGLVKGVRFSDHVYIGDPVNAVRIFSARKADEVLLLDIAATREGRIPDAAFVQMIANESLMPFTVGGGLKSEADVRAMLNAGAEKVCIGTAAVEVPHVIERCARTFGSQCVMVSIDVRRDARGAMEVFTHAGSRGTGIDPFAHAVAMERLGAGELLVNSIDRDGTMQGYDLDLVRGIAARVRIPVIACGGAGTPGHLKEVIREAGVAAAAGSLFVLHGRRRGVLISYPSGAELDDIRGAS